MRRLLIFISIFMSFALFAELPKINQNVNFYKQLETPKDGLIRSGKEYRLGWYKFPFEEINFPENLRSFFRTKSWQYMSFTNDRYLIGMAIVDASYLSNFFLYVFDFETQKFTEFKEIAPGSFRSNVSKTSKKGTSLYESSNSKIAVDNYYDKGHHAVSIDVKDDQGNTIQGQLTIFEGAEPVINSREVLPGRIVYTHQNSMYRPEGKLYFNGKEISFTRDHDFSAFDLSWGMHEYKTEWNWASAAGYSEDGETLAIAFSSATGAFYWVGEKLYRITPVKFDYSDVDQEWKIYSTGKDQGRVNLTFNPMGKRGDDVNVLGIIVSKFYQPFGRFKGTIQTPDGKVYKIKTMKGVTEEHLAKW